MKKGRRTSAELGQRQVQRQDLRLFAALGSPEEELLRQEAELLADPLFARLCAPGPGGAAPIIRKRLPGAGYAFALACGDEALAAAAGAGSAGDWLADRPRMLELARRAGQKNFERWFLSGDSFTPEAAARACGLTAAEAAALKGFADAFVLAHERVAPSALPPLYLRCAAAVSAEGGALAVSYTHPSYLRGAYSVDRAALGRLVRSGGLSGEDAARAGALAARAQRLSWRRAGFHRVMQALTAAQEPYLLGRGGLLPLTQRELAARAGLNPATVCRLLAGKTLLLPGGDEVKLSGLLLPKNAFITGKIREMLKGGEEKLTDAAVAARLRAGYGLRVSRRSVNLYRSKL